MGYSEITFGREGRERIFAGIEGVAKVVGSTMGSYGRNVFLDNLLTEPVVTNDGITVARAISFKDHYKNMGAFMLKKAADKTNKQCGDGTSTTIVLAYAIVSEGLKHIDNGVSPFRLSEYMNKYTQEVISYIKSKAIDVAGNDDLKKIATISAQDPEVGELIAEAYRKVGKFGTVIAEETHKLGLSLEIKNGLEFDEQLKDLRLITNKERMQCELENAYVLVSDKKLLSLNSIATVLDEIVAKGESKDIIFILDDIDQGALMNLIINHGRGFLNICVVKAPSYGPKKEAFYKDICALTSSVLISDSTGLDFKNVMIDHLGKAEKVVSGRQSTLVVGGKVNQSAIDEILMGIEKDLEANKFDEWNTKNLEERRAKLAGGIASIKVGYPTDIETENKTLKVEDAINATKCAIAEGIIYWSGVSLIEAGAFMQTQFECKEEEIAYNIIKKALEYPTKLIMDNAGESGEFIVETIKRSTECGFGYDISTHSFDKLLDKGIIDPVKVVRIALENAVSLANMILTSNAVVTEEGVIDDQDVSASK